MGTEGRELSWDDNIQNDSSFVELPEGDYEFTIDHYERGRSQGSAKIPPSNMAIVFFNIRTPEGQEVTIKENYNPAFQTGMETFRIVLRSRTQEKRGRSQNELECTSGIDRTCADIPGCG